MIPRLPPYLFGGIDEERAGHVRAVALVTGAHGAHDDVIAQISVIALGRGLDSKNK